MSLVLEIEFLTGVCRAARGPADEFPDWPPQPDRVFSALVSAWAVRGKVQAERAALEWLEQQPPPVIRSSRFRARSAPDVYVPPNDDRSSKSRQEYRRVLPERRRRQPRRFPVARPEDPNVNLVWPETPDREMVDALNAIASCVGYVGHSASLARCLFVVGRSKASESEPVPARRRVYPGRLRELEEAYRLKPARPVIRPGAPAYPEIEAQSDTCAEWLVLEGVGGETPDIRASALVCRLLRQALMAGYRRGGSGHEIPEIVSGHAVDGAPTRHAHLAIAPMAFMGSSHADGRVFGFAVIPPRGVSLLHIDGFRAAFERVAIYCTNTQRRVLTLQGPPLRKPLILATAPDEEARRWSLRTTPYVGKSAWWATVTPIVLDRHLKRNDEAEVRELVGRACENAGFPCPDQVQIGKHSAIQGAPPARPLAGEPPWARWKLPGSLRSRQLIHAVVEFEKPICGPVLLGAGRFTGLGLCRNGER